MTDPAEPVCTANVNNTQAEIARLNKIIQALMDRAEGSASIQGSDFNLFQTAIILEGQIHRRTDELESALRENERITRALRESENHNRLLVENAPICIHEIDLNGRISSMNRAGLNMLGIKDEYEVQGYSYLDVVSDADRARIGTLMSRAYTGETSHFEFHASGAGVKIYKSCFIPLKDKSGKVEKLMGLTEDITERMAAEERIRDLAFYDTLTHLPNRRLLNDRLHQTMASSKRNGRYGAVMFLDLDNFKPLNDTHGHDVGDLLLIEVAHRITRCVRESDTVSRFGGDEFVVLLGKLDMDKDMSLALAGLVAEKIRAALAEPYWLTRNEITVEHHCTSSIGAVLFLDHEATMENVLKWADLAMYQAKDMGRNRVHFFGA